MKNLKFTLSAVLFIVGMASCFSQEWSGNTNGASTSYQEPEPVLLETMAGDKWAMLQSLFLKKVTKGSKFSVFNLTNYEKTYKKEELANFVIQTLAYYQPIKNFHVGVGSNLKQFGGFKPLAALAYIYNSRHVTLIAQPSIEFDRAGVTEIFALFEYRGANGKKVEPFFSLQGSSSIYTNSGMQTVGAYNFLVKGGGHDYTYLNARAGVEIKNFRFGPALNFRTFGSEKGQANMGGFLGVVLY